MWKVIQLISLVGYSPICIFYIFELSVLKVWQRQFWTILALFREGVLCIQTGLGEKKHTFASQADGSAIHQCPFLPKSRRALGQKTPQKTVVSSSCLVINVEHWNDESLSPATNSTLVSLPVFHLPLEVCSLEKAGELRLETRA